MLSLKFDQNTNLLPVIVQDHLTSQVLMLAFANQEALDLTQKTGKAHFWSRSRQKLWLKGESSGHVQLIKEILIDCDQDTLIYKVEQLGGAACHKGYKSCFFRKLDNNQLTIIEEPVFDPKEVYK
jgi:phosphoribosyl-AMP cyclohydrolase